MLFSAPIAVWAPHCDKGQMHTIDLQKFLQELYLSVFKTCNSDNQLTSAPDSNTVKVHPEVKQSTDGEKTEPQRVKSSPVRRTSASIQLIHEKKAMLDVITSSFVDKAEELTLNLSDALDRCAKLSALLSDLAPIKHSDRRVAHLLEKLSRFTQGHTLRLHPHNFLRILNSLQLWELCCPDLSVAIEVQDSVTEHFYNGFRLHNFFYLLRC
ncbi:Coiled-coil domain-containing protein 60 [Anabarilius grahami]|uniref:Coiled-coil domain-containing protein 60 n=1 Tax=Anabarilius grahami TaxID=495550 RepID=A0A3N0XGW8_ANAGA|nr:Coiled-coil domain-containing protein 60 [Anabarilius grahami]